MDLIPRPFLTDSTALLRTGTSPHPAYGWRGSSFANVWQSSQRGSSRTPPTPAGPPLASARGKCLWPLWGGGATPLSPMTGFMGGMAGLVGASRSGGQALGASGCGLPLSQGAIPKMGARGAEMLGPHDTAIREVARAAPGHYSDETAWRMHAERS